jgi:hypothetical protein
VLALKIFKIWKTIWENSQSREAKQLLGNRSRPAVAAQAKRSTSTIALLNPSCVREIKPFANYFGIAERMARRGDDEKIDRARGRPEYCWDLNN